MVVEEKEYPTKSGRCADPGKKDCPFFRPKPPVRNKTPGLDCGKGQKHHRKLEKKVFFKPDVQGNQWPEIIMFVPSFQIWFQLCSRMNAPLSLWSLNNISASPTQDLPRDRFRQQLFSGFCQKIGKRMELIGIFARNVGGWWCSEEQS